MRGPNGRAHAQTTHAHFAHCNRLHALPLRSEARDNGWVVLGADAGGVTDIGGAVAEAANTRHTSPGIVLVMGNEARGMRTNVRRVRRSATVARLGIDAGTCLISPR